MLESATVEWIGGGTGKTRFLGEMIEKWEHWRDLSRETARASPMKHSREIPRSTSVFPISFNFLFLIRSCECLKC